MPPKKFKSKHQQHLNDELFLFAADDRGATFEYVFPDTGEEQKWPHTTPSAKQMAEAGFYLLATKSLKDRVCCIGCGALQSKWKGVKNPAERHLEKHPQCWFSLIWKNYHRDNSRDIDWSQVDVFKDPLSQEAADLRRASFSNYWGDQDVHVAGPAVDKMVDAGFCHLPPTRGNDFALCLHCGITLEAWDPDDEPIQEHLKRASADTCYFLRKLEESQSKKRSSEDHSEGSVPKKIKFYEEEQKKAEDSKEKEKIKKSKKSKKKSPKMDERLPSPEPLRRPRRAAANSTKIIELSTDEEDVLERIEEKDESFGLSAHEEQLDSEPEPYRSSQHSKKSANTSKAKPQQKSASNSPIKKSKILDSSLEGGDMFADSKSIDLDSLPPPKSRLSTAPMDKSKPLQDITNISESSAIISPKKRSRARVIHNEEEDEEDDDDEVILVSNSSSSHNGESTPAPTKEEITAPREVDTEGSSTLKPPSTAIEEQKPLSSPVPEASEDSISDSEPSPLASKAQASPSIRSERSESLSRIKLTKTNSNKSILSQTRFFESPKMKRSHSPFLDPEYQGDDQISAPEFMIGDDDPIGESTDHNIQVPSVKPVEKKEEPLVTEIEEQEESTRIQNTEQPEVTQEQTADKEATPSDDELQDSFHSADDVTPQDVWVPVDERKVFAHLDDLNTAKTYLAELNGLDYDLHDDTDGRITTFLSQMPEEELEMTIEEWVYHMAKQGAAHFRLVGDKMISEFDEECDRALEKLKALPTID